MNDDDVLLAPGELLANLWKPTLPIARGIPGVTRTAADGLSPAHVREVRLLADRLGYAHVELITAAFLRAHGNLAEPDAVAKWRPHVERALR